MRRILLILLALATVLSALALSACGSGEAGGNTETAAPETAAEGTKTYTVTWKQYNGDYIKMQPDVPAGTTPVFGQADPTRPDDADNSYVFAGWDPTPGPISGDVTYTATYTATPLAKHEVTSDEFAAALSLDGKSFTMSGRIQAIEASMRFLADYTMVLEGVEEGEKVWFGYVKEDNGTFTYVRATDTDPNGSPIWKIDDSGISPAEMKLEREKFLWMIGQIRAATTYDNYTYDPKTETYKAIVEGSAIELSFSGGKLERASIDVEGVLTYNFSDYGTTVITDDEIAAMRNAGLILEAKKSNDYMDHDWISIGAAKGSAASRKIYAKFEVPDNFDPSAQMLIIGIQ